jgi:hypothetical protein
LLMRPVFLALAVIMHCVAVPFGMMLLPPLKPHNDYRIGKNPSAADPIDILTAADSHVFVAVTHVILRNVSG